MDFGATVTHVLDSVLTACGVVGLTGWFAAGYLAYQNSRIIDRWDKERAEILKQAAERTEAQSRMAETLQFIRGAMTRATQ